MDDTFQPLFRARSTVGEFEPHFPPPVQTAFTPLTLPTLAPDEVPVVDVAEALAAARAEADQLMAETRARLAVEAEALRETVRDEEVRAFRDTARQLTRDLQEQFDSRLADLERSAASLVVGVARRILHEHFEADETAIVPVVKEALHALGAAERATIVVAPRHERALRAAQQELLQVLREEAELEITVADSAPPFGAVIHAAGHPSMNARLEDRLETLQRAVDETLASADAA